VGTFWPVLFVIFSLALVYGIIFPKGLSLFIYSVIAVTIVGAVYVLMKYFIGCAKNKKEEKGTLR